MPIATTSVGYPSFQLTPAGVKYGMGKTEVIRNTRPPGSVHKACEFMGNSIKQPLHTKKDCQWPLGRSSPKDA